MCCLDAALSMTLVSCLNSGKKSSTSESKQKDLWHNQGRSRRTERNAVVPRQRDTFCVFGCSFFFFLSHTGGDVVNMATGVRAKGTSSGQSRRSLHRAADPHLYTSRTVSWGGQNGNLTEGAPITQDESGAVAFRFFRRSLTARNTPSGGDCGVGSDPQSPDTKAWVSLSACSSMAALADPSTAANGSASCLQ